MFIEPFKVELWMNEWETQCTYNLAEPKWPCALFRVL